MAIDDDRSDYFTWQEGDIKITSKEDAPSLRVDPRRDWIDLKDKEILHSSAENNTSDLRLYTAHCSHSNLDNLSLQAKIDLIGNEMVNCTKECAGILLDRNIGALPRCLFLEDADIQEKGCAIVGMNPGISSEKEKSFYLQTGQTYQRTVTFWKEQEVHIRYYKWLRDFVHSIGLGGPILWTELVKCESLPSISKPPIQTFRVCTNAYLSRELSYLHENWPLIGVGKDSFKALSFLYPTRAVLGIPHPTGSHGQFHKIQKGHSKLSLDIILDELWDEEIGKALWLDLQ